MTNKSLLRTVCQSENCYSPFLNIGHCISKLRIDEMAKAEGRQVLRLPPYHCELNPIQLGWLRWKINHTLGRRIHLSKKKYPESHNCCLREYYCGQMGKLCEPRKENSRSMESRWITGQRRTVFNNNFFIIFVHNILKFLFLLSNGVHHLKWEHRDLHLNDWRDTTITWKKR